LSKPFRSDKRKKELQRLKKQEEKRLRRFGLKPEGDGVVEGEVTEGEATAGEVTEGGSEITEVESDKSEAAHLGDTSSEDGQSETKQITE
jgi:hypothetical protein